MQTERTEYTTEEARTILKEIYLPMALAQGVRTVAVYAVGRKLFPEVFTGFGRSVAISWLAAALASPVQRTPKMKRLVKDINASAAARKNLR